MLHPWLLLGGAALVAGPVLIHLLNRRRFRTVDWAAMEFLLEAQKRNRRRVQLENLLLLLLRCLAVLFLGWMLARPFLTGDSNRTLFGTSGAERIVLLDDSLSMSTRDAGQSAMDRAKTQLVELIRKLGQSEDGDSFSLHLVSDPKRPVLRVARLDEATAAEVERDITELTVSHKPARWQDAMLELEDIIKNRTEQLNRVVYVVTDLRSVDWDGAGKGVPSESVQRLRNLASETAGCYVVDAGANRVENLAIVEVIPREKVLLQNVASRFDVVVANTGGAPVRDVPVSLTAGQATPLTVRIDEIAPGKSEVASFTYTFTPPPEASDKSWQSVPLTAQLDTVDHPDADVLLDDNSRFFAAEVLPGVPTLLVDGSPSSNAQRAETLYIRTALAAPGQVTSGLDVQVVTDVELDSLNLDAYDVIFLCNVLRLEAKSREALQRWVAAGGGLVICLGDQVDERSYNDELYASGKGLLPARLVGMRGDDSRERWVNFELETQDHPAFEILRGESNPFVQWVNVYRWWATELPEEDEAAASVRVPLSLTDAPNSPAVIEKNFGEGKVVMMTTSIDAQWNNWTAHPQGASYLISMQELARYLTPASSRANQITVGDPISQRIDLTRFRPEITLERPDGKTVEIEAAPDRKTTTATSTATSTATGTESSDTGGEVTPETTSESATPVADSGSSVGLVDPGAPLGSGETLWKVHYNETGTRGFYRMPLVPTEESPPRNLLVAANFDPDESQLEVADKDALLLAFKGTGVELISADDLSERVSLEAQGEFSSWLGFVLFAVLFAELSLAGWIGRRRDRGPSGS